MSERRLQARGLLEDALDARLGQQVERRRADAEPVAPHLDLVFGLLPRAVEHRAVRAARSARPPAAASVDLPMPGSPPSSTSDPGTIPPPSTRSNSPRPVLSRSTATASTSAYGRAAPPPSAGRTSRRSSRATRSSTNAVPRAALGASSQPLRRLGPTFLTGEDGLGRRHGKVRNVQLALGRTQARVRDGDGVRPALSDAHPHNDRATASLHTRGSEPERRRRQPAGGRICHFAT